MALKCNSKMKEFVEDIFELAFGFEAYEKGYSYDDVLNELTHFSDLALKVQEESGEI